MKIHPYLFSDVDQDRRLVHLLNETLMLPRLHKLGLFRRTLKARVLPVIDSNAQYKDGLHRILPLPLSSGLLSALHYNVNAQAVDFIDVLAVFPEAASEAEFLGQQVLFDHLRVRDHPYRRPVPVIKSHRSYRNFIRTLLRHVDSVGRYIGEFGADDYQNAFDALEDDFERNVLWVEEASTHDIERVIYACHAIIVRLVM